MYVLREVPDRKVLVVGQAPARFDDPTDPISGRTGRRLAGLMGLDLAGFKRLFSRANLLNFWPGKDGKGDAWPAEAARLSAERMRLDRVFQHHGRVLLLGRAVEDAIGADRGEWMVWVPQFDTIMATMPHPSGIVRWWNDGPNKQHAAVWLENLRRFAESGSSSGKDV